MNTQEFIVLVYKNLKGEISPTEFTELNALSAHDPALAELRLDIEDAWDVSGEQQVIVSPAETQQLFERITGHKNKSVSTKKAGAKIISLRRVLSSVAAIFLVVFGITWLMQGDTTVYNTAGQHVLADGSKVTLREGSQLEVNLFDEHSRSVTLNGEAHFEVTTDEQRPFKVLSDNVNIEVLGTKFLVKDKGEETFINLEEGKIKTEDQRSKKTAILTAGMKAQHSAEGDIVMIEKYNNLYSWHTGAYKYKDIKLGDVLEELALIHGGLSYFRP